MQDDTEQSSEIISDIQDNIESIRGDSQEVTERKKLLLDNKRSDLYKLLDTFAQSNLPDVNSILLRFEKLYQGGYRHFYSDVYAFLNKKTPDERDAIEHNFGQFYYQCFQNGQNNQELLKSIQKLYDHINLECRRMLEYDQKVADANGKLEKTKQELQHLQEESSELEKKINGFNTQSITILGIFSAVVFAFTGGFTLLSQAFTAIDSVSKYRLFALTIVLIGALFDVLYLLLFLIANIAGLPFPERKNNTCAQDCSFGNAKKHQCLLIRCAWRRHPFITLFNGGLLIAFIILIALQKCGF